MTVGSPRRRKMGACWRRGFWYPGDSGGRRSGQHFRTLGAIRLVAGDHVAQQLVFDNHRLRTIQHGALPLAADPDADDSSIQPQLFYVQLRDEPIGVGFDTRVTTISPCGHGRGTSPFLLRRS